MILLDTHALIWWIENSQKLSKKAKMAIEKEKKSGLLLVSSISVWEIYLLVAKGRLQLAMDTDKWIEVIESLPFVQFVPIDNVVAAKSVTLQGEFHPDPAARMIVATAREKGITLVTGDERIRKYPHIHTLW